MGFFWFGKQSLYVVMNGSHVLLGNIEKNLVP